MNMWNKFKSLFAFQTHEAVPGEEAVPENSHGDYAVRRNRKFDVLARCLAIVAAVLLWIYVVNTTTTSEERVFSLVPVEYKNEATLRAEHGLMVQSINIDTLNVTLMGSKQDVRAITADQVKAYVNLSEITEAGEHSLNVYVDVPSGITMVSQTVAQVLVSVDAPSSRVVTLTSDDLLLRGWSLAENCTFGNISLSTDELTLEGPALALQKVKRVELRSDVIGSAQGSFTVTATPYLLDAEGNEIQDNRISIRNQASVQAHVEVLKSKTVSLTVESGYGGLPEGLLTISPSAVTVMGDPQTVDALESISLGAIDVRSILADETMTMAVGVPNLVISDGNGNPVSEATVTVKVSSLPTRTVDGVKVWRGEEVSGTVSVTVRGVSADYAVQLQALTAENIVVYSDPAMKEGSLEAMSVVFSEFFRDVVYEIELSDYRTLPAKPVGTEEPIETIQLDHILE